MNLSPFDRKVGRLEEFLVSVLLANIKLGEVVFRELLHQHGEARNQLLFGVAGVIDEGFVLRRSPSVT